MAYEDIKAVIEQVCTHAERMLDEKEAEVRADLRDANDEQKNDRLAKSLELLADKFVIHDVPLVHIKDGSFAENLREELRQFMTLQPTARTEQLKQELAPYVAKWMEKRYLEVTIDECAPAAIRLASQLQPPPDPSPLTRLLATSHMSHLAPAATFVAEVQHRVEAGKRDKQPEYLSHREAFAMLNIEGKTSKERSKIMASIRVKAGKTLKCHKAGNVWKYDPQDWRAVVKLIRTAGGVEKFTDPPHDEVWSQAKAIRNERMAN